MSFACEDINAVHACWSRLWCWKNKSKGCQGCWHQVKVDKSVHCVWSLNSQVLCAFGNVYFYNSLSQVGAKRWMFTVWLFTIKKIAVTAVTKEKQHSKQNTNKSQSYEVWDDKELFKSKKIAVDRFTSHKSVDIELHLWAAKHFHNKYFPRSQWWALGYKYFRTQIISTDWESDECLRILRNESRWVGSAHLFSCFGQKLLYLTFLFQPTHFHSKRVHFWGKCNIHEEVLHS